MRQYISLIRHFEEEDTVDVIREYLRQNQIRFKLEADLESEIDYEYRLRKHTGKEDYLLYKYTFLGTEEDITAISIIYDRIRQVEPTTEYKIRNWFRRTFSIFFN